MNWPGWRCWWRSWRRAWQEREGMARLRALDEFALRDLGLSRSDIPAAARALLR